MADANVSHEKAVEAVRQALVVVANKRNAGEPDTDALLKAAQAYELTTRAGVNY